MEWRVTVPSSWMDTQGTEEQKVNQVYEKGGKKFKRVHIAPLRTASLRVGVRGGVGGRMSNKETKIYLK